MSTAAQLPLTFDHRPALSGEDFLVAECNAEAVAWIDRWPDWPSPALVIHGPAGCGKSHLAAVFGAATGARNLSAVDLRSDPPKAGTGAVIIEDADSILEPELEAPLFHLYNRMAETGERLLLTGLQPPGRWTIGLADLRSRLNAATAVGIGAPDDALIQAVLVKLFADRQLTIDTDVIAFVLPRMERSFEAARRLVAAADQLALAEQRRITVPLIKRVLDTLNSDGD